MIFWQGNYSLFSSCDSYVSLTDSMSIITYFSPIVYKFPIFILKDQCYITVSIQDNYPSISVFISSILSSFCFLPTTMHWATFLSSLSVEALPLQSQTHLSFLIFNTGLSCLLYWLNGVKNRIKTQHLDRLRCLSTAVLLPISVLPCV